MSYLTHKDLLSMSLYDIIQCKKKENIYLHHEKMFTYISDDLKKINNRELIKMTNNDITLYDWEFLTIFTKNEYGYKKKKQRVIGYLANENEWKTSDIKKIRICFSELLGYYLKVKTISNHYYNLPLYYARYSNEYLNMFQSTVYKQDFRYHPSSDKQIPEKKQFVMDKWEIINKAGGYYLNGYKYFKDSYLESCFGTSHNLKISSIIFHNNDNCIYMEIRTLYGESYKLYYDDSNIVNQKFLFN